MTLKPQVTMMAASVVAVLVLGWSGYRASRLAATRTLDVRRAQSTLEAFAGLRQRYEPAAAAESIAWRRTLLQLRELGVVGDERLTVTQHVARAAEAAGLRGVKVNIILSSDTTGQQARPPTEGVQSKPAPFSLVVECRGGLTSVVSFLGALPPSVAPTTVRLVRQDGGGPHRISLAVYELTFPNGAPSGWSSVERDNPRGSGSDRPGG
jgi:hypothetical protein